MSCMHAACEGRPCSYRAYVRCVRACAPAGVLLCGCLPVLAFLIWPCVLSHMSCWNVITRRVCCSRCVCRARCRHMPHACCGHACSQARAQHTYVAACACAANVVTYDCCTHRELELVALHTLQRSLPAVAAEGPSLDNRLRQQSAWAQGPTNRTTELKLACASL